MVDRVRRPHLVQESSIRLNATLPVVLLMPINLLAVQVRHLLVVDVARNNLLLRLHLLLEVLLVGHTRYHLLLLLIVASKHNVLLALTAGWTWTRTRYRRIHIAGILLHLVLQLCLLHTFSICIYKC